MEQYNRRYRTNHHRPNQRNLNGSSINDSSSSSMDNQPINSRHPTHHWHSQSSCTISICYSYLIAIFSSFLVVLGIYLALTKFNARFLYISLVGLLIEAVSACLFCVSSIRQSQLAQHKQTRDESYPEDEVIANRQYETRAVTYILTNRALNNQAVTQTGNEDSTSENQANIETRPPNEIRLVTKTQVQSTDSALEIPDTPAAGNVHPSDNEPSNNCQDPSRDIDNPAKSEDHQIQIAQHVDEPQPSTSGQSAAPRPQLDQEETIQSAVQSHQLESGNVQLQTSIVHQVGNPSSSATDETDLIPTRPQASKRNPRRANMRRTLVMGLSGEEEVIEIDEQDLDEMSILPPSYESIAKDCKLPEQMPQQHQ